MPEPVHINTVADLVERGYTIGLFCPRCRRWSEADLGGLVGAGKGGADYTRIAFRCRDCGTPADRQLRPPMKGGYPVASGDVMGTLRRNSGAEDDHGGPAADQEGG